MWNASIRLVRVFGVQINIHVSWFLTLCFITTILALEVYPEVFPRFSPYRDDTVLHWLMAAVSGLVFFVSILAHELAHSLVARHHGVKVRGITLFALGGMAQTAGDPRRPWHEFLIVIVGPLTSVVVALLFLAVWWLGWGLAEDRPLPLVLEWLFFMNLIVGIFNLAPAFPMDGGRVLRAFLWGVSHSYVKATRWATWLGQALGLTLIAVGVLHAFDILNYLDRLGGLWIAVLGFFLQTSARTSWFQVEALTALSRYRAGELMAREIETVAGNEVVRSVVERTIGRQRYIFLVFEDDQVIGALSEKETAAVAVGDQGEAVRAAMLPTEKIAIASLADDGATILQLMEAEDVWHVPVIDEQRVVGVVSKDSLLRIIATQVVKRPRPAGQLP
jgi:Zn-dependent protease/predicted transcriptional regulator